MFFNSNFILASSSLSRYKILKNNKLNFTKMKPLCNEEVLKKKLVKNKIIPSKISLSLARLKAQSISKIKTKSLVVGCDTTISLKGALLNKAKNLKDAKSKIKKISGKHHHVCSSASVFFNKKEIWKCTQKTLIKIRPLKEQEINTYLLLAGNQILTSVGCYQIEILGPNIIEEIKGDFFNVMGFPLFPFLNFLKNYKSNTK